MAGTPENERQKSPAKHHSHTASDRFDLVKAGERFDASVNEDETDIGLLEYVDGYDELNKMFPLLGRLFTFVQSDVSDKIGILRTFLSGDENSHYESVKRMMDYEKGLEKHRKTDPPSGCRTLLRLHRALLYVCALIDGVRKMGEKDGSLVQVARSAYDETLSVHHTWIVRKAVHVAIYAIPKRKPLILLLAGDDITEEAAEAAMEKCIQQCRRSYNIMQKLYEDYAMLDLP